MVPPSVRDSILKAAMVVLQEGGARRLAQPQVAKAAGVLQGHLTYYFPKRSDLLAAVAREFVSTLATEFLQAMGPQVERPKAARARALFDLIRRQAENVARTRVLLALLVEADQDQNLRAQLVENARLVKESLAMAMGKDADDPDVVLVQAAAWGLGLRILLMGESGEDENRRALSRAQDLFSAVLARSPVRRRYARRSRGHR